MVITVGDATIFFAGIVVASIIAVFSNWWVSSYYHEKQREYEVKRIKQCRELYDEAYEQKQRLESKGKKDEEEYRTNWRTIGIFTIGMIVMYSFFLVIAFMLPSSPIGNLPENSNVTIINNYYTNNTYYNITNMTLNNYDKTGNNPIPYSFKQIKFNTTNLNADGEKLNY
jgi:hypothetical protein